MRLEPLQETGLEDIISNVSSRIRYDDDSVHGCLLRRNEGVTVSGKVWIRMNESLFVGNGQRATLDVADVCRTLIDQYNEKQ